VEDIDFEEDIGFVEDIDFEAFRAREDCCMDCFEEDIDLAFLESGFVEGIDSEAFQESDFEEDTDSEAFQENDFEEDIGSEAFQGSEIVEGIDSEAVQENEFAQDTADSEAVRACRGYYKGHSVVEVGIRENETVVVVVVVVEEAGIQGIYSVVEVEVGSLSSASQRYRSLA